MKLDINNSSSRTGGTNRFNIALATLTMLCLFIHFTAASLHTTDAKADVKVNHLIRATLLGDSYSAGNGAGDYYGEDGSYKSHNNWAHNYVNWLNDQGAPTTLDNLAHSGHVTNDLTKDEGQVDKMDANTNLVMFTIGGNDVNFSEIVKQCFALGFRDPGTCKKRVEDADANLDKVKTNTTAILQKIDDKLADDAQVISVGYPRLASNQDYVLDNNGVKYDAGKGVRALGDSSKDVQSSLTREWNASHSTLKVTYVDGIINAFDGHDPNPKTNRRNPHRWINEFLETEGEMGKDGTTKSKPSKQNLFFYHPNIIGHKQIAQQIEEKVGIPEFANLTTPNKAVDVAFVIDSTGSMKNNVDAVRSQVKTIANETKKQTSSYRFSLVDYKDHPNFNPDNYLARTDVAFTSDMPRIENGLGNPSYEGGNLFNTNASVYSGVMQAVNMKWRNGVKKIVIVI